MNLNFVAEHTADPESGKTFLRNWGILQANRPICNTYGGHELSKVKIGRGDATARRYSKQKISTRKGKNKGIKEQDFIILVFLWSLLGVHSAQIESYVDEFMGREKHGKTENDCFDIILLHICQWYALK